MRTCRNMLEEMMKSVCVYITYTPNLGLRITVFYREREQGCFRGSNKGARGSSGRARASTKGAGGSIKEAPWGSARV